LLNLRPYVAGDPPRLIHWKATARMGKLMIRQLAQEGEAGYHLCLDVDEQLWNADSFETLCSLALSLGNALFHAGRLESVHVSGRTPFVIRSMRDLHDYFDLLALLEPQRLKRDRPHLQKNTITFRPSGERDVAVYVDEKKAGQIND
jgi:uncharacterized protein (DUF58 family)